MTLRDVLEDAYESFKYYGEYLIVVCVVIVGSVGMILSLILAIMLYVCAPIVFIILKTGVLQSKYVETRVVKACQINSGYDTMLLGMYCLCYSILDGFNNYTDFDNNYSYSVWLRNEIFYRSCTTGDVFLVKQLKCFFVAHPYKISYALKLASKHNKSDIVELLLPDSLANRKECVPMYLKKIKNITTSDAVLDMLVTLDLSGCTDTPLVKKIYQRYKELLSLYNLLRTTWLYDDLVSVVCEKVTGVNFHTYKSLHKNVHWKIKCNS